MANFLVGNDDSTECAKGPLGLGKLLSLPFSNFSNKDVLSLRDCHLDSFVNFTNLYHVQRRAMRVTKFCLYWLLNFVSNYFMVPFPTTKAINSSRHKFYLI